MAWRHRQQKYFNGATRGLKIPGIGTDYLMAVIYIKEFRNQAGVAVYKSATNKTDDWLRITKIFCVVP